MTYTNIPLNANRTDTQNEIPTDTYITETVSENMNINKKANKCKKWFKPHPYDYTVDQLEALLPSKRLIVLKNELIKYIKSNKSITKYPDYLI